MNFKTKVLIQRTVSGLPFSNSIYYFIQRYVAKSFPVTDQYFRDRFSYADNFFDAFIKYKSPEVKPENSIYFEFGAGWDLIIPVAMSLHGFKELHVIDIDKWIHPELLRSTFSRIKFFYKDYDESELLVCSKHNYKEILKKLRIIYDAPRDAARTNFRDNEVDLIVTFAVLEHIPPVNLHSIINECYRILKPGGVLTMLVDYKDHYSYFDTGINLYNFLRYSTEEWKKYCSSIFLQNRLRHIDYVNYFKEAGFTILEENPIIKPGDHELLESIPIHPEFLAKYTKEELMVREARFVVTK